MWLILLAVACGHGNPEGDDTGQPEALGELLATTDVLVIGAGTAGMAAAYEAVEAGADVIVLEREGHAGGSSTWAGRMWAAGTALQAAEGVDDSPEKALGEWTSFTNGDPENPLVQRFVYESAETLEWLESFGMSFISLGSDPETGSVPRIHGPDGEVPVTGQVLAEEEAPYTWLNTAGVGLVKHDGAIVGVKVANSADGTTGWVQAGAVVLATGGMVRDEQRLLAAHPELAETGWVSEAFPLHDGNGLDMASAVGAELSNLDSIGVYAHSVDDPRFDHPGVALLVVGIERTLIVNPDGARVMNEDEIRSFGGGRTLLEEGGLTVIADSFFLHSLIFSATPFDWGVDKFEDIGEIEMTSDRYQELTSIPNAGTPEGLADLMGMNASTLRQNLERYNSLIGTGSDLDFGKDVKMMPVLDRPPFYAIPLRPGPSKSYGGVTLGNDTEVLDSAGAPIPGLYAAGEVAGVLGGTQTGWGFSGSVTACWWGGRVAGQAAAAYAQDTPAR